MKDGFIKVSAATPDVRVGDCEYNAGEIIRMVHEMEQQGAKVMVFPELCITSYSCGDLFWQETLLNEARIQLMRIARETEDVDGLIFVGLPLEYNGKLYNVAAGLNHGEILGFVPKIHIPNYNEFYEGRYFTSGKDVDGTVTFVREPDEEETDDEIEVEFYEEDPDEVLEEFDFREDEFEDEDRFDFDEDEFELEEEEMDFDEDEPLEYDIPVSPYLMFTCTEFPELKVCAEICEDLWVAASPSLSHAYQGANLIVNLSASDELAGKDVYRRSLVALQSAKLVCGYAYASAGDGESTQDVVYAGHNLIAENGSVLAESRRFTKGAVYGVMDIHKLNNERRRMTTCQFATDEEKGDKVPFYSEVFFSLEDTETDISGKFDSRPFVPDSLQERSLRCDEILNIQAVGLKKRLAHIHCKNVVIGLSGGLDSTLALLVTVRAFDMLGLSRNQITAVTMPCFGTTDRTYNNACELSRCLGAELREVNIKEAVSLHFRDIGHDPKCHDVTYENSQARERTQILMDIANQMGGIVIGTGDLSELALGWATYNGDHMSMYGVNSSVPKTLVRHLVRYYADTCKEELLQKLLLDILDTPVSPELLPPKDGVIAQKTEDLVGPYELHDFFLYHMLRWTCPPQKLFRIAKAAFAGEYDDETILKWLKTFYRRFFNQQFKRSCLPDGPKVGSVAVSPRGDLRMPSDACGTLWLKELDKILI